MSGVSSGFPQAQPALQNRASPRLRIDRSDRRGMHRGSCDRARRLRRAAVANSCPLVGLSRQPASESASRSSQYTDTHRTLPTVTFSGCRLSSGPKPARPFGPSACLKTRMRRPGPRVTRRDLRFGTTLVPAARGIRGSRRPDIPLSGVDASRSGRIDRGRAHALPARHLAGRHRLHRLQGAE